MRSIIQKVAILAAMVITGLSGLTQAQSTSSPNLADWGGYYRHARGEDVAGLRRPEEMEEIRQMALDHLQPWALAKMEATDFQAEDFGQICLQTGPFKYWFAGGTSFLFLPGPDKIVMPFTNIPPAGVRRIYLDQEHPRNLPLTWNGHSVGHWEGDTLVVDTYGFNDRSWLVKVEPHSEHLRMTERIRFIEDRDLLEFDITFSDREAMTSAYNFVQYYKKTDMSDRRELIGVCNQDPELWRMFMDAHLQPLLQRSLEVK